MNKEFKNNARMLLPYLGLISSKKKSKWQKMKINICQNEILSALVALSPCSLEKPIPGYPFCRLAALSPCSLEKPIPAYPSCRLDSLVALRNY